MMTFDARTLPALGALAFALAAGGCSNDHEDGFPLAPNDPGLTGLEPPTVSGLRAFVGSRSVTLVWDELAVAGYRVLRKSGEAAELEFERASGDTTYTDGALTNGVAYRYRVSAILANGLQGDPSDPVFVVPGVYSVLIEGGRPFANDTELELTLSAPAGTASMRFGEAPGLDGVAWRPFDDFALFEITPGEGTRTLYAQFVDQNGNESAIVMDSAVLDTRAEILSVSHDAGAAPVAPGTVVRFAISAGEAGGAASIDIAGGPRGISLFDDGAHGDGGADDGVYAVDWSVPTGTEVRDAVVSGAFTDAADNAAGPRSAPVTLTINAPPSAVVLDAPANVQATSLDLSWSQCPDTDFDSYRVLRARTADVVNAPDRRVLAEITSRSETGFTDEEVIENETLFYLVRTVDAFGAATSSNTVSVSTPNGPPRAVVLSEDDHSRVSVSMSWTESQALDFALYRVLRAIETAPGSFSEVAQFDQQSRTTYTDFFAPVADTTYYFYKVEVEDLGGETTESNVISVGVGP